MGTKSLSFLGSVLFSWPFSLGEEPRLEGELLGMGILFLLMSAAIFLPLFFFVLLRRKKRLFLPPELAKEGFQRLFSTLQTELAQEPITPQALADLLEKATQSIEKLKENWQRELQEITSRVEKKREILDVLEEGVIAVNLELEVTYLNRSASRILGIPQRLLLGEVFPTASQAACALLLENCRDLLVACKETKEMVSRSLHIKEGHHQYLELIAIARKKEEMVQGVVLILQDKTVHYRVLEMGREFIANASHELRTPITIIRGFAETLPQIVSLQPQAVASVTEKIIRSCARMETLCKHLLLLTDIENQPPVTSQKCILIPLIEKCIHQISLIYPHARITLEKKEEELFLAADGDLLEIALLNILENGIKYSDDPPHLFLGLKTTQEGLEIAITDQGKGIPLESIPHLFERFYTVDKAHSRKLGGAGLGLSIVKTIVDKHGGEIRVQSTLGKGSTFTLFFPKVPLPHTPF